LCDVSENRIGTAEGNECRLREERVFLNVKAVETAQKPKSEKREDPESDSHG
jgi:hypothetical protein